MAEGTIVKALSGFYYVMDGGSIVECKARGKFRLDGTSPLVGDKVFYEPLGKGKGQVGKIKPRRNWFIRPAVANIDCMVFIAANTYPVTDPFLIDRVSVITEESDCDLILCINKTDLDAAENLREIYKKTPYRVICTSAETGEGIEELKEALKGKISVFTGNSGVGKSSILNAINPEFHITTNDVSVKLGRGKHTTRHVELYEIGEDTFIADTPGFASFEIEMIRDVTKENLQFDFPEFSDCIGKCRFNNCAHLKEPGCAVTEAVAQGIISDTRYDSYQRLYELTAQHKPWETKQNG